MFAFIEGGGESVVEYGSTIQPTYRESYHIHAIDFALVFVRHQLEPEPLPNLSVPSFHSTLGPVYCK